MVVGSYHRIIESFELEEAFKGHQVQHLCNEHGHLQLHRVLRPPRPDLECPRDGAPTTSLGNLCQCLTALTAEHFPYIKSKSLLLQFETISTPLKSLSPLSYSPLRYSEAAVSSPQSPLSSRLHSPSSQPVLNLNWLLVQEGMARISTLYPKKLSNIQKYI